MKTPRTDKIAHAGLSIENLAVRMIGLARELEVENNKMKKAIRQTIGWNESCVLDPEAVRLLEEFDEERCCCGFCGDGSECR